ncbi:MAG: hypothetical protein IJ735_03960 [Clostridia bacterium]|nr:hypothetical protein [Clostridia bacterium]
MADTKEYEKKTYNFDDDSLRNDIQKFLVGNDKYKTLISELKNIEILISDFAFLSDGRNYLKFNNHLFSLQKILISIEFTISNVIACCYVGCIADANTLARKFTDDLFFYLYILVYDTKSMQKEIKDAESNIESWVQNKLKDLDISKVLKSIGNSTILSDVVKKYNLENSFKKIGSRLNDFVHSNGQGFYNDNTAIVDTSKYLEQVKQLIGDVKYITITFFILLSICCPCLIMSSDYVDFLEVGEMPPEGSQYLIAPFIAQFIKNNYSLIDQNCLNYLQDNTCMKFD